MPDRYCRRLHFGTWKQPTWLFIACECLGLEFRNQLKRLNIYCYRSLWLKERGMLHLERGCCGLQLIERGMLHLERASCGLRLIERGMLHLGRASCGLGL